MNRSANRPLSPGRAAISGAACMAIGMGISRFVYTPILPAMKAAGLTPALAGYLAAANYLGYLLGALWPLLLRKINLPAAPRQYLLASLLLAILATAAMAVTGLFTAWLVIRLVAGMASAWTMVYASTVVLELLAQARAPRLVALHYAGVGGGITLSGVLVAAVSAGHVGWQGQWIAAAGLIAALLPLAWPVLSGAAAHPVAVSQGTHPPVATDVSFSLWDAKWLVSGYFCFGLGYVVTATFLPLIARQSPALAGFAGLGWILVGLAAIPSNSLWVGIAQRKGYVPALMLAYAAEAFGVILPALSASPLALFTSAILLGGTFMGITAVANACARALAPRQATEILAAMTAAFGAGQVLGPAMAGRMAATNGSFSGGLWVATAALVVGILLLGVQLTWKPAGKR